MPKGVDRDGSYTHSVNAKGHGPCIINTMPVFRAELRRRTYIPSLFPSTRPLGDDRSVGPQPHGTGWPAANPVLASGWAGLLPISHYEIYSAIFYQQLPNEFKQTASRYGALLITCAGQRGRESIRETCSSSRTRKLAEATKSRFRQR